MAKKTTRKTVSIVKKKSTATKKKKEEESSQPEVLFDPRQHVLVPKHEVLSQEEVEAFFVNFHVSPQNLPIVYADDVGLSGLDVKMGDIIKVTRKSLTAGEALFYRRVAYE